MSRSAAASVTPLRDRHGRHTHMCRRIFLAAAELVDESTAAELSVRELAARARVSPSAVGAHFPTLDALFAELYLHRIHALPLDVDPEGRLSARVGEQLRAITYVLAGQPGLAAACNRALLTSGDAAVAQIRIRIAAEVHRRVTAALGPGAWPEVAATLETVFWGALMQIHSGAVSYDAMAARLETMLALILPEVA